MENECIHYLIYINKYERQTDRPHLHLFYQQTMEGHWGEDNSLGDEYVVEITFKKKKR